MPEGLHNNEKKEAWDIVHALDAAEFLFSAFGQWLKANNFQVHDVGRYYTFKGTYGYVQIEFCDLGGKSLVVRCTYIPHTDTTKAFALVSEGVSASGKSLSNKNLKLLKLHRYEQVELIVTATIMEQTGERAEPDMNLRDDLGLDDELDIPEIIMKLEDEFDCIITDNEVKNFETVEDMISFIRNTKGITT